jgi:UbiA prenyltransferase family
MKARTFLELGRTSNLPTVLSNVLTGSVVATGFWAPHSQQWLALGVAALASVLFYVGGMFLNDAFDAAWDSQHRPERPIPRGDVTRNAVFTVGTALLLLGLLLIGWLTCTQNTPPGLARLPAVAAALATVAAVLTYDIWHKGHPWAPLMMGLCRAGVVAIAALLATAEPNPEVWLAAFSIGAYVVGLTHVARFETTARVARQFVGWLVFTPALVVAYGLLRAPFDLGFALTLLALAVYLGWTWHLLRGVRSSAPRAIPKAVGGLIAGLALVDAAFVASRATWPWVLLCWGFFRLTLRWQRRIAGT